MKILAILLLFCWALKVNGQTYSAFGANVGVNGYVFSPTTSAFTSGFAPGGWGGLYLRLYYRRFFIAPEAAFNIRGGTLRSSVGGAATVRLFCLDFPVTMGYDFLKQPNVRLGFKMGIVPAYIMSVGGAHERLGTIPADSSPGDFYNSVLWSVQAGVLCTLRRLSFELRYEYGLTQSTSPQGRTTFYRGADLQSSGILFGVGFRLIDSDRL